MAREQDVVLGGSRSWYRETRWIMDQVRDAGSGMVPVHSLVLVLGLFLNPVTSIIP